MVLFAFCIPHPYFVYVSVEGSGQSVHFCTGLHEASLLNNVISTKISCADSYIVNSLPPG